MAGAFLLWDDVLKYLTTHLPRFLALFINRATSLLTAFSATANEDPIKDALYRWLVHIMLDQIWSGERQRGFAALREAVVSHCMLEYTFWGQKLARALIQAADDSFRREWAPVFNAALPLGDEEGMDVDEDETTPQRVDLAPLRVPG